MIESRNEEKCYYCENDGEYNQLVGENDNYIVTLEFEHYNFIPMNEIVADYPITNEHKKGYHLIKSIKI